MASNEIVAQDGNSAVSSVRSTLRGTDTATRRRVLKAVTNAEALSAHLGETILVEHIVQQRVTSEPVLNEATGELQQDTYVRTVLVGPEGHPSYVAASKGIENSIETIIAVLGDPNTWDEPEAFVVKEEGKKPRAFMTLIPA